MKFNKLRERIEKKVKNKWILLGGFLVSAILLAFVLELFVYNGKALFAPKYSDNYASTDFEKVEGADNQYLLKLEEEKYIKQLSLQYNSERDFNYTVSVGVFNNEQYDNYKDISDIAYSYFEHAYTDIGKKTSVIKLTIADSIIQSGNFRLTIENKIIINGCRVFFWTLVLVLAGLVWMMRKRIYEYLEYFFLVFGLGFGILMISVLPLGGDVTWDNEIHFKNVYSLSQGKDIEITSIAKKIIERTDFPAFNTIEEKHRITEYVNEDTAVVEEEHKSTGYPEFSKRAYLLPALGMKAVNAMGLPFSWSIHTAEFMNLLLYVVVIFFAIRYAKINKIIPMLCGCIPTLLFQAVSFSYDAFVAGWIILGTTLILGEIFSKEELRKKRLLIGIIAIVIGSFSKAIYIPLLLLVLFIPHKAKNEHFNTSFTKIAAMVIMCIMLSTFVLSTASQVASGVDIAGDARGGATSTSEQLKEIVSHPVEYAHLLFNHVTQELGEYTLGDNILVCYKYINGEVGNAEYVMIFLLLFVALTIGTYSSYNISGKRKIQFAAVLFVVLALMWTALYLSFTPIGLDDIRGVQPRYYLPLLMLFLFLLYNKRVKVDLKLNQYTTFIVGLLLYVQGSSVYHTMIGEHIIQYILG